MKSTVRFVGLDVHKESIVMAVAESDSQAAAEIFGTIPHDVDRLLKCLKKLGPVNRLRCCYEAGPTGYGLYRALEAAGIDCVVVAPSLVPVQTGRKLKTDRRDARRLAHFLRSGDLTAIWVPDAETEALRDLERSREDAKRTERVARQQLGKFLLRNGRVYRDGKTWTKAHQEWMARQKFDHPAQQRVLEDYLQTVREASARVQRLTDDLASLVENWERAPLVQALLSFRGVQLITAATVVAEVGDFRRFATAGQFMAYLGLVPSEYSSGQSRRQGAITKTGNGHVRRVLTEAAWNYRFPPRLSPAIQARSAEVSPEVQAIAWKAQQRLHRRYSRMMHAGKPANQVATAVARELAGFLWAAALVMQRRA